MSRILVVGALFFVISPCQAGKARVDFDHAIHFTGYKTYSWARSADAPLEGPLFPNQLMRERIAGFIEEALAARGLKRVGSGGDLEISFSVEVQEQPEFITLSDGVGPGCWGCGWGSGFSTTTVQIFYNGTVVVDMVDASRRKLVFQGTSSHEISSKPAENTKKLAKAVNEIFKNYPPRP